jgi:hypothetical protein
MSTPCKPVGGTQPMRSELNPTNAAAGEWVAG